MSLAVGAIDAHASLFLQVYVAYRNPVELRSILLFRRIERREITECVARIARFDKESYIRKRE